LYIITDNLAVPIVTHTLYDFYTFYKTHLVDVAGQMEYAKEKALMPICSSKAVENKWIKERGEDWLREAKQSFYLMDTNRDGGISRKELCIALYSYGINLSKVRSQQVKQVADIDISGSIDFDEVSRYVQGYCFYPSPLGFLLLKLTNLCFQSNSSLNITVSIAIVFGIYWTFR